MKLWVLLDNSHRHLLLKLLNSLCLHINVLLQILKRENLREILSVIYSQPWKQKLFNRVVGCLVLEQEPHWKQQKLREIRVDFLQTLNQEDFRVLLKMHSQLLKSKRQERLIQHQLLVKLVQKHLSLVWLNRVHYRL